MKYLLATAVLILFPGCGTGPQQSEDLDRASVTVEVRNMFDNYHADIKASGLTAEFKYLDNSEDFFWVPPGYSSTLPYDSVRAILENNAKAFSAINFYWDTLQIFPASKTIATYSGIVEGTMIDTAGIKTSVRIIESGVVIKRNDGWKLLSGQSAALKAD